MYSQCSVEVLAIHDLLSRSAGTNSTLNYNFFEATAGHGLAMEKSGLAATSETPCVDAILGFVRSGKIAASER